MYKRQSEYRGMFISNDDAVENVTSDTLIVVLDTHRPSMLPCPKMCIRDRINREPVDKMSTAPKITSC